MWRIKTLLSRLTPTFCHTPLYQIFLLSLTTSVVAHFGPKLSPALSQTHFTGVFWNNITTSPIALEWLQDTLIKDASAMILTYSFNKTPEMTLNFFSAETSARSLNFTDTIIFNVHWRTLFATATSSFYCYKACSIRNGSRVSQLALFMERNELATNHFVSVTVLYRLEQDTTRIWVYVLIPMSKQVLQGTQIGGKLPNANPKSQNEQ